MLDIHNENNKDQGKRDDEQKKPFTHDPKRNVFIVIAFAICFANGASAIVLQSYLDKITGASIDVVDLLDSRVPQNRSDRNPQSDQKAPNANDLGLGPLSFLAQPKGPVKIDPIDVLIGSFHKSSYDYVDAQSFSGVDKHLSEYVWNLQQLDHIHTDNVLHLIYLDLHNGSSNHDDTYTEIQNEIDKLKNGLAELVVPTHLSSSDQKALGDLTDSLIKRHEILLDALKALHEDPNDSSMKSFNMSLEIEKITKETGKSLTQILTSNKKY